MDNIRQNPMTKIYIMQMTINLSKRTKILGFRGRFDQDR